MFLRGEKGTYYQYVGARDAHFNVFAMSQQANAPSKCYTRDLLFLKLTLEPLMASCTRNTKRLHYQLLRQLRGHSHALLGGERAPRLLCSRPFIINTCKAVVGSPWNLLRRVPSLPQRPVIIIMLIIHASILCSKTTTPVGPVPPLLKSARL